MELDIKRLKEIIAKKGDDKGSINVVDEEMTEHHSPIHLFERTIDIGHLFEHSPF